VVLPPDVVLPCNVRQVIRMALSATPAQSDQHKVLVARSGSAPRWHEVGTLMSMNAISLSPNAPAVSITFFYLRARVTLFKEGKREFIVKKKGG
jgi:hypothetical protein